MTKCTYSDAELRSMSPADKAKAYAAMAKAARADVTDADIRALDLAIEDFEQRAGFLSAEMREKLAVDPLTETWMVCCWLITLDRRDNLVRQRRIQNGTNTRSTSQR